MLLGKNTNVRHAGVVFHVQTEDSGVARPHVITHLYHQGTILASEKRRYAELVKRPDLEARVRALMDEQHERMHGKLRSGELDGLLGERLGGAFAKGARAKRARAPEITPPSLRLEETLREPPPDPILEAVLAVGRLAEPMQGPPALSPAPASSPARATIACPISPYEETRDAVRAQIGEFVEVHVDATVEEIAANRDPKGLYKKALAGEITGFTGVDDPYEPPESPEIYVDTISQTPEESLQHVLTRLKELGRIESAEVKVTGERVHSGLTDLRVTEAGTIVKEH